MSILLIQPPLTEWGLPGLGLAVLGASLREQGVPFRFLEANHLFHERFATAERYRAGVERAAEILHGRNDRDSLSFREASEYCHAAQLMKRESLIENRLGPYPDRVDIPERLRAPARSLAMQTAALPFWPEGLERDPILSAFSYFSTDDLLASVQAPGPYGDFFDDLMATELARDDIRLVGIALAVDSQALAGFRCAAAIRRLRPDLHITMGGGFVSCHFRSPTRPELFDLVDSLILDDGEAPLGQLWRTLGEPGGGDLARVPALIYRHNSVIHKNPVGAPLPLATAPDPDFSILPLDAYPVPRERMSVPIRLSRGCAWGRCSFCRTDLPLLAHCEQRSADQVFDQIVRLRREQGFRNFSFIDESLEPDVVEALCLRLAREGVDISWKGHLRFSEQITPAFCAALKAGGCKVVKLGLESFSDRLLRKMRKGISAALIERCLETLAASGLQTLVYVIIGFPGETAEEADRTYAKVCELQARGWIKAYQYSTFNLLSGSRVALHPEEYGITRVYPDGDNDLDPPLLRFESDGLSRSQVMARAMQYSGRMEPVFSRKARPVFTVLGRTFRVGLDTRALAGRINSVDDGCGKVVYASYLRAGQAAMPIVPVTPCSAP